jgi:hypothetical protein
MLFVFVRCLYQCFLGRDVGQVVTEIVDPLQHVGRVVTDTVGVFSSGNMRTY